MKKLLTISGAVVALALGAQAAHAQSVEVSTSVGVTNDYIFRGVSQSDEGFAFQAGSELSYGGFYGGLWGSTVDFGDDTDAEVDLYGGYRTSIGAIDLDFGAIAYFYVGAPANSDYDLIEFKAAASTDLSSGVTLGAALYYSPDFFGIDEEAFYYEANAAYEFSTGWSLSGAVGQQKLDVSDDYYTWNVGVGVPLSYGLGLDVRYHNSDVGGPLAGDRISALLTYDF